MAIAFHPWIIGVPHRIGFLEELLRYMQLKPGVVFMSGSEILDWYIGSEEPDAKKEKHEIEVVAVFR